MSTRYQAPTFSFRSEQRALLLAARTHLDSSARDSLISLVRAGLDFDALARLAARHGLTPLLSRSLHRLGPTVCPPDLLVALRNTSERSVHMSFAHITELLRVLEALRARDVPALAIKGPISASLCYGDLGLRTFADVDVLIDASDVERAAGCLGDLGYVQSHAFPPGWLPELVRNGSEMLYRHPERSGRLVDLHWSLMPRGYTFSPDREGVFAVTQLVRIGGTEVPTLGNEATLLFLLVHGMKHDWVSLGWLCDVAELIRRQAIDWDAVLQWSQPRGPRRFVDIGLALAHALLDAAVPEPVLVRGAGDGAVRRSVCMLAERLFNPGASSPFEMSIGSVYFRSMQRRRDQLRFLHDVLLRPTTLEWNAVPLPPALAPLHYLVRPVRLLWKHGRPR